MNVRRNEEYTLITGGCGFIGTNLADRLLSLGRRVMVFDNLAREGVENNLRWLRHRHGSSLDAELADIRDAEAVARAVRGANAVYHFAAQVAVTTSLTDPVEDFDINVRGTLNLLEALRARSEPAPLLFTSTNKVYGGLEDVGLERSESRWLPAVTEIARNGIGEARQLDFHSPYGCSKGAADQYVLDYARTYSMPNTVFRMSCIYGPHQWGNEDQGWVAHFLIRALENKPITIYGDGGQVRDALYISDLVDGFLAALEAIDDTAGQAFNLGGGPGQSVSLLELLQMIEMLRGSPVPVRFGAWREGDQRYYVADTRKFQRVTGWRPQVPVREGVRRLFGWVAESRGLAVPRTAGFVETAL